jgi:hypothetical protein
VHSKEQIIASADAGGSGFAQFSQMGRSSSMVILRQAQDDDN